MTIQLGGVNFDIKANVGRSPSAIRRLRQELEALREVSTALGAVSQHSTATADKSAAATVRQSGTTRSAVSATKALAAAQTSLRGSLDQVREGMELSDRVIRNRIRLLGQMAQIERQRRAQAAKDAAAEVTATARERALIDRERRAEALAAARRNAELDRRSPRSLSAVSAVGLGAFAAGQDRLQRTVLKPEALAKFNAQGLAAFTAGAAGANQYRRTLQQASDETNKLKDRTTDLAGTVNALVAAFGAAKLVGFLKEVTLLAGRVENLDTVMRNTANTANFADGELTSIESQIKALGITTQVTREIMARFAQNQLDVADAAKIARISQDAAVVAGINSSQATERMAVAIQRLDTRMLRNLGLLVNLRQEYQQFGLQTGRVETSLTAAEKQQIVLNAVIREGAALAGNYEAALGDVFKQFTSLDRKIEEAQRNLGEQYLPAFGALVAVVDRLLEIQAGEEFQLLGIGPTVSLNEELKVVKTLEAVLLAAGTAAITTSAAVGIANLAVSRFALTATGMAASTAAAAASTSLLSRATAGLTAVIAANPVGAAVVATTAAVAGLAALASSVSQQAKQAREEAVRLGETAATERVRLQELRTDIDRLGSVEKRTEREQILLNAAMQDAIKLLPEHREKLNALTDDYRKFSAAIAELRPEVALTDEQVFADLRRRITALRQTIDAKTNLRDFANPRAASKAPYFPELEQELARLKAQEAALIELRNEIRLRKLDERDEQAETAHSLSLRLRERLDNLLIGQTGSDAAQTAELLKDFRDNLSTGFESIAEITSRFDETIVKLDREFAEKREEATERLKGDAAERVKALAELDVAEDVARRSARQKFESDTLRREGTLKAFQDVKRLAELRLENVTDEVDKLQRRIKLLDQNVPDDFISALEQMIELQQQSARTIEVFDDKLAEERAELNKLQRALLSANVIERESIQKQIDFLRSTIDVTEALEQQAITLNRLKREAVFADLLRQEREALKELAEQGKDAQNELTKLFRKIVLDAAKLDNGLAAVLDSLDEVNEETNEAVKKLQEQIDKDKSRLKELAAEAGGQAKRIVQALRDKIRDAEELQDAFRQRQLAKERQLARELIQTVKDREDHCVRSSWIVGDCCLTRTYS